MSAIPSFTMRELLEAGVHYGHKTKRWDPRMAPYLFGIRNDIHIIDLQQTVPLLSRALSVVQEVVAKNGRVLFVGTKRAAQEVVAEEAKRCGQYYVNHRWLGGMLTNWKTISQSIKRLRKIEQQMVDTSLNLSKKERLQMDHQREKLERSLGGIKDMGGLPDLLFVIDTNKEALAISEATRMGIPVIAVLDSNSNPDGINYPVPGNDDSTRAIGIYCRLISSAALVGLQNEMRKVAKRGGGRPVPAAAPESLEKLAAAADAAAATAAAEAAAAPKVSEESLKKLAKEKSSPKKAEKPAAEVEVKKTRKVAAKKDEAESAEATVETPAAEKKAGKKKAAS